MWSDTSIQINYFCKDTVSVCLIQALDFHLFYFSNTFFIKREGSQDAKGWRVATLKADKHINDRATEVLFARSMTSESLR